ncbi:SNF2 family N-terminal domain-containing protein [Neurospora hispaniola]|uniref:Chromatin-remodeling ATPase INO80 n=1 Tax=Neurospora hispaniola TaxID=588809 RepID=A0AAJ0IEK2_9PEZI|nr:SNF2 family N-terminal domain-containing protein [Neurospora hispaniola]
MDHFSTVLQRPPHFDEDGTEGRGDRGNGAGPGPAPPPPPRGGLRDILNPVSSNSAVQSQAAAPPPPPAASSSLHGFAGSVPPPSSTNSMRATPHSSSSFNLRSPTQQPSEYRHPLSSLATPAHAAAPPHLAPFAASPPTPITNANKNNNNNNALGAAGSLSSQPPPPPPPTGPRSILNPPTPSQQHQQHHHPNPFVAASAPSLPPPPPSSLQAPPAITPIAGLSAPAPASSSLPLSAGGIGNSITVSSSSQPPARASQLHAPSAYYSPAESFRDRDSSVREKSSTGGSFYDPTAEASNSISGSSPRKDRDRDRDHRGTTRESQRRRVSGHSDTGSSWRNATQTSASGSASNKARDPYNYSPSSADYYNTRKKENYPVDNTSSSSIAAPSNFTVATRSPVAALSHPASIAAPASVGSLTGSISPRLSLRPPSMASPTIRSAVLANPTNGTTSTALPALGRNDSPPSKMSSATSTNPSRAAGVMSFSNILSSSEPVPRPRATSPNNMDDDDDVPMKVERADSSEKVVKEKKERKPRQPKQPRISDIRHSESTPKGRRGSTKQESPLPNIRIPAKRTANGAPKQQKTFSAENEEKIRKAMDRIETRELPHEDEFEEELRLWRERREYKRQQMNQRDLRQRRQRRADYTEVEAQKLKLHADFGKRRYDDLHYDDALQEVRERELFAEKERKKDMQRKRRREKSMATTMEAKAAALARASAAQDEAERQKYMREAERANKKVQQTRLILQKGIKGPSRNTGPIEPNLEGGTMATFQAENMEPGKTKGKGRAGARPKKSKEQKQAEKDAAEAAQAALDAGLELPPKEETNKIRIKLTKTKAPKEADVDKDKENKEPQEPKEPKEPKEKVVKEKVVEEPKDPLELKFQSKGFNQIYDQIWRDLARKDVNKVFRLAIDSYSTKSSNLKKTAILASKEAKRWQLRTNKGTKDLQARAKRVMRDMMGFWKRNEREERDLRKAAEKQELENARKEEADREAARQKRKLNFLISQTELYSHFIGKKIKTNEVERSTDHPDEIAAEKDKIPENEMDIEVPTGPIGAKVTNFENLDFDAEDESTLRAAAMANAQNAIAEAQKKAREFNKEESKLDEDGEMNFQNPTMMGDVEIEQPKLLNCQLKEYQLKGLNWLVNLYEQGINGILADEMGLGKTVQSISVMAYLAEKYDIWGPFLVVAPASTLHNWQQEITKFVPQFKVLPYWGTAGDRKVLRKFWDRKHTTYKKDAPFHVMITSYQLVVSDVAYFQKMKWQYMILDEAQAIKSSQSSRWKCLLGFHCRNRLLLTGTPIQNNMQELWALLHFIMPSLFDSHDEFSEWFSKDIESHAQSNTKLNEDQLKRLHMILKPFMLRRVKKHVQKELGDKIEMDVFCDLTYRQRAMYANLRNQISIMDLIEKATLGDDDSASLMNLVMQFRKVCNHPDLFERADTASPYSFGYFAETASFIREGSQVTVGYSTRSLIQYELPRLLWRDGGRLHKAGEDNQVAGWRNQWLNEKFNIWTPEHIRESLAGTDNFSWLRFADTSYEEAYQASHKDLFARAVEMSTKKNRLAKIKIAYDEPEDLNFTPAHALFQIREREDRRPLAEITEQGILGSLMNVSRSAFSETGLGRLEQAAAPKASAPPIEVVCDSRSAVVERENIMFNAPMRKVLFGPTLAEEKALVVQKVPPSRYPPPALLPAPDKEKQKFTNITVPSMRRFVTDSGKLAKLDELLRELKENGHRVLLYFQMTRMIDLMEEYLTYRNYKYCRLDGSTKLEDRRDTVADFQTRPEIFIFLLSTRAGGLGINLTSADTVIFYDSDWNPTIDSQAMDRAHRLGQTKQVTVYRLITKGTIEERIRKRAMQKEEVQRVVITGGSSAAGGGVDFSGRRAPENRNRDIAMWLADDEQAEMIEKRERELLESGELDKLQKKSRGGNKRKRGGAGGEGKEVSLDEMYHEGEGNFDDGGNNIKGSGTATPNGAAGGEGGDGKGAAGGAAKKRKTGGSKKAKTTKQRLAIADGEIDI